jgi:hypothetical protein
MLRTFLTLTMEAEVSSETLVFVYSVTRYLIAEEGNPHRNEAHDEIRGGVNF